MTLARQRPRRQLLRVSGEPDLHRRILLSQINELLDRNVMTIDAFDWATARRPTRPNATTTDLCTSRPARPYLYEGTFAHEYQHLLQYYQDPQTRSAGSTRVLWDSPRRWSATSTRPRPSSTGADSHICYQGFGTVQTTYNPNPRDCRRSRELPHLVG